MLCIPHHSAVITQHVFLVFPKQASSNICQNATTELYIKKMGLQASATRLIHYACV